jgi:predicted amino acid dehydrogenase
VERLEELRQALPKTHTQVEVGVDMNALRTADIVIAVSSATGAIIQPEHLRSGAVVCDVARPRDVAARVAAERDDVLVIDGGMVDVPGSVNFNFDFGFPPGKAYACMAETIALTLEGRFEDYTIGKHIQAEKVDEITKIATRHGFHLSGLRSFERDIHPAQINSVRERARLRLGATLGA